MTVLGVSFTLYTLFIVGVGVYSSRFAKATDDDYFLAGRGLGAWVGALSACASVSSGWVTLGLVGLAFDRGFVAYWLIPGVLVGVLFNWAVLANRLRHGAEQLGALTVPDYFAFRFKERLPILRGLSVLVILIAMILYVSAQMAASGKAFDAMFASVDHRLGVVIGAVIVLGYTVIGGFRAACWTDSVQAVVMVVALAGMPIYLLVGSTGYSQISETLGSVPGVDLVSMTGGRSGYALIGFVLGSGALGINLGYPGQPHVVVRYMAMRGKREVRTGMMIAMVWTGLAYWGAVTIGLIARTFVEQGAAWSEPLRAGGASSETALIITASNLLPGAIAGIALAAVLAAIASTADSQLVVAASAVANDLYARVFAPTKKGNHGILNKSVVLVLGIGAAAMALDESISVYSFVVDYGWAILGASFGPQLILALLWKRASYAGAIAGIVTGFVVAIVWKQVYAPGARVWTLINGDAAVGIEIYNLTIAFVAAFVMNVVVSLAFRSCSDGASE